jgi:YMGG-like Gly-zipper
MKRLTWLMVAITVVAVGVAPAFADTLVLKDGQRVSGYFEGGTARVVKFRGTDGATKDYDILQVDRVLFDATPVTITPAPATVSAPAPASSPAPAAVAPSNSSPILRPASERPPAQPPSSTAANTGYTIPTGSKVVIQLIDAISSETSKEGSTFVAILDEPLSANGAEVAPKGADVRGRITTANDAGRVSGKAELALELTQLYVNGIPYALSTSEYSEAGESRTGETVKRAGIGAGIGAVIGAIAGGGKGAAIGAGVGGGAGTATQVLTKGEKLNIPSETKLEFTLRSPLVIAAR